MRGALPLRCAGLVRIGIAVALCAVGWRVGLAALCLGFVPCVQGQGSIAACFTGWH